MNEVEIGVIQDKGSFCTSFSGHEFPISALLRTKLQKNPFSKACTSINSPQAHHPCWHLAPFPKADACRKPEQQAPHGSQP